MAAGGSKHRQKRTFAWIKQNARSISTKLKETVQQIGDNTNLLEDFDGENLIMNSAMTKIVGLADPDGKLIIYDGRVGSALAFFVTKFSEERTGKRKDRSHAVMMRRASGVVVQVAQRCGITAREIEAALFMWGYRVGDEAPIAPPAR